MFRNFLKKTSPNTPQVIAVCGTHTGCGVTHFCLLLANHLTRSARRIAYLECSGNQDLEQIESAYQGYGLEEQKERDSQSFRIRRVDYYKEGHSQTISHLKAAGYQHIILDLGRREGYRRRLFEEADVSYVIAQGCEWKLHHLANFYNGEDSFLREHWVYLLNMGSKEEKVHILRHIGIRCQLIPFHKDPFVDELQTRQQIQDILGQTK